jgi:L-amino acid N-acyltransferase YncA
LALKIRRAELSDLEQIIDIWLQRPGASTTTDAANIDGYRSFVRERVLAQNDVFHYLVADEHGQIVGWSSLQPMRNSPSLSQTMAEYSVYIRQGWRGRRIALRLHKRLYAGVIATSLEWIIAYVGVANVDAVRLFEATDGAARIGMIPAPLKNPTRGDVETVRNFVC